MKLKKFFHLTQITVIVAVAERLECGPNERPHTYIYAHIRGGGISVHKRQYALTSTKSAPISLFTDAVMLLPVLLTKSYINELISLPKNAVVFGDS